MTTTGLHPAQALDDSSGGSPSAAQLLAAAIDESRAHSRAWFNVLTILLAIPIALGASLLYSGGREQSAAQAASVKAAAAEAKVAAVDSKVAVVATDLRPVQETARATSEEVVALRKTVATISATPTSSPAVAAFAARVSSIADNVAASRETLAAVENQVARNEQRVASLTSAVEQVRAMASSPPDTSAIDKLAQRMTALETQVAGISRFRYISYAVRENAETPLYDIGLGIKLGPIKDESITLDVFDTHKVRLIGTRISLSNGGTSPVVFSDKTFDYQLLLVYTQKRLLARDILGIAVGRREKP